MPANRTVLVCALAASLFAAGLAGYSVLAQRPPKALPKDAPADLFSAHRAIAHGFACSAVPHPAGSRQNDEVAKYFLEELRRMGVEAEFMSKPAVNGNTVRLQQAVIGRIPGTDSTGSVAFSAHYDSVPYGPGATDDIAGCVAMLEAARALMNRPRPRNDVVFVFADAEEIGGYGAEGFCTHPLAAEVGVMSCLDVRGTRGTALVFETSSGNGAAIRELRAATAHGALPVSSSLMFAIYKASPFGGDFTRFRNAGMKGYNVAYIDKFMWYHTMNDSPEHMDPESIQHFGAHVMGTIGHFGNADFATVDLDGGNDVYFNALGFNLVQYPLSREKPLAVLAIAALLLATLAGLVTRRITVGGYVKALLLFPVAAGAAAGLALGMFCVVFGYENVVHLYTVKLTYVPEPRALYDGNLFCISFGLMALAAALLVHIPAARRLRAAELQAAAMVWLCPLVAGAAVLFPGGAYLFTWPVLFGTGALLLLLAGSRKGEPGPGLLLAAALFAAPALCLLPPGWQQLMWMINILGAPILAALVVIILLALMPVMSLLARVRRSWTLGAAAAVLSLVLLGAGLLIGKPCKDRPLMNSVVYTADLDSGKAFWLSEDVKVDEWTKQFFPKGLRAPVSDLLPWAHGDHYLRAEAPVAESLGGVRAEGVREETVDGKRRVTMRLFAHDAPYRMELRQTGGAPVTAATVAGVAATPGKDPFSLSFELFPAGGYEVVLETEPGDPPVFEAFASVYGFPEIPSVTPRPAHMVPEPNTMRNGITLRSQHMYITNRLEIAPAPAGLQ
ncbi:MAG TPA: M20/M25/M40 family metallo-hydrolase [Candidatus Hydrogenedentes bacterium]|nr:M20/M25/M40 family metallo-hydrolase [Candidatus Hydrogenedentota bacterium]